MRTKDFLVVVIWATEGKVSTQILEVSEELPLLGVVDIALMQLNTAEVLIDRERLERELLSPKEDAAQSTDTPPVLVEFSVGGGSGGRLLIQALGDIPRDRPYTD